MKNLDASSLARIEACAQASLDLLQRNLTPHGILAASRTEAAEARRYTRIFGRDAAICVIAMCGSGVPALEQGAVASLEALAAQQAANGQIPKYVDPDGRDADFWYLGCIDATLWWLIAVDHVRRHGERAAPSRWRARRALARSAGCWRRSTSTSACCSRTRPATGPTSCRARATCSTPTRSGTTSSAASRSTTPRPRSYHFNHLFNPFQRDLPEYHRARLLRHYARRGRRDPGLYLSFVNLAVVGDEGDVFGNVLAIQCGLADEEMARRIVDTIAAARAADPYPVRVVLHPLAREHPLWRAYMGRHQQNHRAPVPQRRHLALRRRLLGDGARPAGPARTGLAANWRAWRTRTSSTTGASPSGSTAARWRPRAWPGRAGTRRPSCSPCARSGVERLGLGQRGHLGRHRRHARRAEAGARSAG